MTTKQDIIDRLKGKKVEPSANLNGRVDLIRALNKYHLSYDKEDARKWIIEYCKQKGMVQTASIMRSKEYDYPASICSLGFCCRLNMRGASHVITDEMLQEKLSLITPKAVEKKVSRHKPNPLGILYDSAYDKTIETKTAQSMKLEGTTADINDVLKQARRDLEDIQHYPDEYDKAIVKPLISFLTSIVDQKPIKKAPPRVAKPKPPSKLVSKLRYQKQFDELNLKSISPEKIIGARELYAYDTKTRQLSCFVSDSKLSVSGISIMDYNPDKSFVITIRKPQELFAPKHTHRTLTSALNTIKASRRQPRQRLTETTILLSVK